jgi:hypothetical protein
MRYMKLKIDTTLASNTTPHGDQVKATLQYGTQHILIKVLVCKTNCLLN